MSLAFYNDTDEYVAEWLRNLIRAGEIAPGVVDTRSISDIKPYELFQYTQVHFFAGIGGWSRALRQAGWPDDRPAWTGSCPCQPFSQAGAGAGFDDERHLWPDFLHLIQQCRPAEVFGEQVASKDGLLWSDLVRSDLEGSGYAFAAADICAAGVGAPHIRQRLYWVANSNQERFAGISGGGQAGTAQRDTVERMAEASGNSGGRQTQSPDHWQQEADRSADQRGGRSSSPMQLGPADNARSQARQREALGGTRGRNEGRAVVQSGGSPVARTSPLHGFWADADWLLCRDGKWRAVEPGTQPLVNGVPGRVGQLRAYGNAIVPQDAQVFIEAYLDIRGRRTVSSPYGNSVWNEGAAAARAGVPSSRNPYQPTNYNFVVWLNGWAFAKHQKAKEDDEEL